MIRIILGNERVLLNQKSSLRSIKRFNDKATTLGQVLVRYRRLTRRSIANEYFNQATSASFERRAIRSVAVGPHCAGEFPRQGYGADAVGGQDQRRAPIGADGETDNRAGECVAPQLVDGGRKTETLEPRQLADLHQQ